MPPISNVFNRDCMEAMREFPDKFFELAIVDPEYGIGASAKISYHARAFTNYKPKKWDTKPAGEEYFNELFRVSKNQIIWGGNYFELPPSKKPIVWDKRQPEGIDQAMFEYAWSSLDNIQAKIFRFSSASNKNNVSTSKRDASGSDRIHPTQKPINLYKWLLTNYAKPGDKILDTHLGSGSSRIAAWDMGFDFWGYEIDADYFGDHEKRFQTHISKPVLFAPEQMYNFEQKRLFENVV
jgi:site-specific DNA-methyltransferase (adenine-specific)